MQPYVPIYYIQLVFYILELIVVFISAIIVPNPPYIPR